MRTEIFIEHGQCEQFKKMEMEFKFPPETEEQRAARGWLLCELEPMMYFPEGLLTSVSEKFKAFLDARAFPYLNPKDVKLTIPKTTITFS